MDPICALTDHILIVTAPRPCALAVLQLTSLEQEGRRAARLREPWHIWATVRRQRGNASQDAYRFPLYQVLHTAYRITEIKRTSSLHNTYLLHVD